MLIVPVSLASSLDACSGSTEATFLHTASANCSPGSTGAQVNVLVSVAAHFYQVFVNDTLLSGCFATAANSITCPLPASFTPGSATVHAVGTTADGVDPIDFTDPVTIPNCSTLPGGYPDVTMSASCSAPGRYMMDIRFSPATTPIARVNSNSGLLSCTLLEPGHLGCPVGLEDVTPVPSGDGIPVSITFEPPVDLGGGSVLLGMSNLVPVGACTRSGTSGGLNVGPIACSPTGIGFFAHVNTDPGAGYSTISWQSGTERHACSADPSTPNRWNCQLPSVVPADISICGGNGSGTTCFPHPEILAALPSRCGGSPNSPTGWNLALGCFGSTSLRGNVTLSTGNTVLGVNENFNGSSSGLAADLGIPNAFVVSEDFPLVSGNREFCASFAGGTSECRTYTRDEVAAVAPVSCPQTGGGTPGIGGLCADNPSASGWQNPGNSFDVNNDGCVTAQDVLLLINALNHRAGDSSLVSPRPAGSAFVDVSGDGQLTPIDVLMVINYL